MWCDKMSLLHSFLSQYFLSKLLPVCIIKLLVILQAQDPMTQFADANHFSKSSIHGWKSRRLNNDIPLIVLAMTAALLEFFREQQKQ